MAKRHKSRDERQAEQWASDQKAWEQFLPRLEAASSVADLLALWAEAVPEGKPGRKHYSNLGFFLHSEFSMPDGANESERAHYRRVVANDPKMPAELRKRMGEG